MFSVDIEQILDNVTLSKESIEDSLGGKHPARCRVM